MATTIDTVQLNGCYFEAAYDVLEQSVEGNYSKVRYYGILHVTNNYVSWSSGSAYVYFSGNVQLGTYYGKGDYTVVQYEHINQHNSDGSLTIGVNFGLSSSFTSGGKTGVQVTFPPISRSFSKAPVIKLNKNNEVSFTCDWTTSEICSGIRWKKETDIGWTNVSSFTEGKSGTFTVGNLSPGTTYTIRVRCTRKDSQVTSDATGTQTTYDNPYVISITPEESTTWDLEGESSTTVSATLYNPLNRRVTPKISIEKRSGTLVVSLPETTSTSSSTTLQKSTLNGIITTSQSATLVYWCQYLDYAGAPGTSTITKTNTYQLIESECAPVLSNLTYTDSNETTYNVINDGGQTLVQNKSILAATVGSCALAYNATIKTLTLNLGAITVDATVGTAAEMGSFNYTTTQVLRATVTDSRGWTHSITKNVNFIAYEKPRVSVVAHRINGYGTNAEFIVNASYSSLGGKNSWLNSGSNAVKYSISPAPATPAASGNVGTTNNLTNVTISITGADNNSVHTITIYANDKISEASAIAQFGKGEPTLAVFPNSQFVGVNTVPTQGSSPGLYVNGMMGVDGQVIATDLAAADEIYASGTQNGLSGSTGALHTDGGLGVTKDGFFGGNVTIVNSLTVAGKTLLNWMYPVGSIYTSVNSTSPATLFGGTWEQIKGKFLVGLDDTQGEEDFNTAGATGGAKTVTLTVDQLPAHSHMMEYQGNYGVQTGGFYGVAANTGITATNVKTKTTGSGAAHENLPPYLVVYMWKRTA